MFDMTLHRILWNSATRIHKNEGDLMFSGSESSSCSTGDTRCVTIKQHEYYLIWKSCWTLVYVWINTNSINETSTPIKINDNWTRFPNWKMCYQMNFRIYVVSSCPCKDLSFREKMFFRITANPNDKEINNISSWF